MKEWTGIQKFIFTVLILLCINYIILLVIDKANVLKTTSIEEGFEGGVVGEEGNIGGKTQGKGELYTWISDPQLIYDEFYAGVYDQLSAQTMRTQSKVALVSNFWKKGGSKPEEWNVLDVGCGTGHAAAAFSKLDVGGVVGLDFSPAMLRYAEKTVIPQAKLTPKQEQAIRWRTDTLVNSNAVAAGEFSHITCFYFTIYYIQNQEEFFRHANYWLKPGGKLCVEVVNKHKFDPILESASPFLGFSLQKYSKERIHKSKVTFDKFEYEAEFVLSDPKAEFYETFRFKNNYTRRQKHVFMMPNIDALVSMAKRAGFKYIGYQDMNTIGFEYGYLLMFEK